MLARSPALSSICRSRGWAGALRSQRRGGASSCGSPAAAAGAAAPGEGMEPDVERLVRAIHASPAQAAVVVTGGGSQGVSWLLCVPGASGTLLEAVVPYSRGSLADVLGQEPAQFCSPDTALALAHAALRRAAAQAPFGAPLVGLGATCALASEPPKRGAHRAYVAAASGAGCHLASLVLAKGARSRWQEEQLVGRLLLQVLARAAGVESEQLQLPLLPARHEGGPQQGAPQGQEQQEQQGGAAGGDELRLSFTPAPDPLLELLAGRARCVEFSGGTALLDAPRGARRVYLPGSFNPLHAGHTALLDAAVRGAGPGAQGCFELTVANADKGVLELGELRARVAQFVAAGLPLLVTSAPLLVDKARLLPGATFVLGWDTAARVVLPKYYGGDGGMAAVFEDIRGAGCRFLVAGRLDGAAAGGRFRTLADIQLPPGIADLFAAIPEAEFRADVSSTALRAAGQGPASRAAAGRSRRGIGAMAQQRGPVVLLVALALLAGAAAQRATAPDAARGALAAPRGGQGEGGAAAAAAAAPRNAGTVVPGPTLTFKNKYFCYGTGNVTVDVGAWEDGRLSERQAFLDTTCLVDFTADPAAMADCRCADENCGTKGMPPCCPGAFKAAKQYALADSGFITFTGGLDGWYCRWNRLRATPAGVVRVKVAYTLLTL
ncbi:hypothetical protein HT031_005601 [Scenedesmus sp. PABB004]|nr:hypothetical protein HT031_005601 [Scenedesmus sp. PABB004]